MVNVKEFADWVATLNPDNGIAIDDGGLTVAEIDSEGKETGAYYEVGGIPEKDNEESA